MTEYACHTDVGRRENLEDATGAVLLTTTAPRQAETAIFTLADGAGGHEAGEVASALAVSRTLSFLTACLAADASNQKAGLMGREAMPTILSQAMRFANEAVMAEAASAEHVGMASTVVCGVIAEGMLFMGWAGDSRGYLYGEGGLRRLTRDHSEIQRLVDAGLVDAADAPLHPLAHTIYRYLGQTQGFAPEVRTCRILPGDLVMLCSDGLTDALSDLRIADEIRAYQTGRCKFEDLPVRLVEAALAAGAMDNVTVLCCEYVPAILPPVHSLEMTLTGTYPVALSETFSMTKEIDHVPTA